MAVLNVQINRPPPVVWGVLADGYSYARWVVGTQQIRDVDDTWPEVGASIHYTAGAGPLHLQNRTIVRVCEPERNLQLEAFAPPLGSARIAIEILPWGDGSVVVFDEHPLTGPGARLHSAGMDILLRLRNRRTVRNLRKVVEERGSAADAGRSRS